MKKTIFCFVITLLAFTACQKNTNSTGQSMLKKGLLWQVSKKDTKTSYLYGTMHVSNEKVIRLSDMALDELGQCQVMAGELVMKQEELMSMMMHIFMKDTTLEMLLSPEQYKVVHKKLEDKMGMMAGMLEKMKPVFVSALFHEQGDEGNKEGKKSNPFGMGGAKKPPLDMYLQEVAKEKGKEVVGLETIEEQLAAFNTITLKEQATMLYETIVSENQEDGKSMEAMLDLYYRQEIDSLYILTNKSLSKASNTKLLIERNTTMADRMEKIMKEKSVFTAIGAAHLAGNTGLIELLRKRGYTVTVIK